MKQELKNEFKNAFNMTDARCVVHYDDLMNILEAAGFDEDYCKSEQKRLEDYNKVAKVELTEAAKNNDQQEVSRLIEKIAKNAPQPDAQKVLIFQTQFLQQMKDNMSMILLTTL